MKSFPWTDPDAHFRCYIFSAAILPEVILPEVAVSAVAPEVLGATVGLGDILGGVGAGALALGGAIPSAIGALGGVEGGIGGAAGLGPDASFTYSPEQIANQIQPNLAKAATLLQEPGGAGELGQTQALGEVLGSGQLGAETAAVGEQFAPQLIGEAFASGSFATPAEAAQFLQAFGYLPATDATAAGIALPDVNVAAAAPEAAAGGAGPSLFGIPLPSPSGLLSAINPIGTAQAGELPPLQAPTGLAPAGPRADFPSLSEAPNAGGRIDPATGGPMGVGSVTPLPGGGPTTAPSSLVTGGAAAAPPAPGAAPIELQAPSIGGLDTTTNVSGSTAGTTAAPPSTTPPATATTTGPVNTAAVTPPTTTPPTTTSTAPTTSAAGTSGGEFFPGATKGTVSGTDLSSSVTADEAGADKGLFGNLKAWANENQGLLSLAGLVGGLGMNFLNKPVVPGQATNAPTQAGANAFAAQGPANQSFQTAAQQLIPAAQTGLATAIQSASPIIQQQSDLSAREGQAAIPLLSAETTGQLPPGIADSIRSALSTARGGVTNRYANLGLSGSSTEGADVGAVSGNIIAQIPGILSSLVSQGIQEAQGSGVASGNALAGVTSILNGIQGLNQAVSTETGAAGGVTNAANAVTNAAQTISQADLGVAKLQLEADNELNTALAALSKNLALSQISPSSINVTA